MEKYKKDLNNSPHRLESAAIQTGLALAKELVEDSSPLT